MLNPGSKHSLGVGILTRCRITFGGSLGYFGCGLIDGPEIRITGRVGWSACENMMSGVVIVDGNAGSLTAAAIRGGDVVKGRVGARTGIDQKGGTVIVLGDAGSMTGFMMQRGRQILCGNVGPGLGDSMYDGTIYVAGKVKSLGIDCVRAGGPTPTPSSSRKFQIYGLGDPPELQKFVCGRSSTTTTTSSPPNESWCCDGRRPRPHRPRAQPDLHAGGHRRHPHEGRARPLPHARLLDVQADPALGRAHVHAGHADPVRDRGYREKCLTKTMLGARFAKKPIELDIPVYITGMSFGALSLEAKMALAEGASMAGTATCSGEGGMIRPSATSRRSGTTNAFRAGTGSTRTT